MPPTLDRDSASKLALTPDPGGGSGPRTGVSVIIPCYNEEENVEAAYQAVVGELAAYDLDILFVDDGSTDGTLAAIRRVAADDVRVRHLTFTRNFGFEAAFSAGFRYARRPWSLQLDADLQFPAGEGAKLISRALEGYDAVYGVREQRHDPLVRRCASRIYHFAASRVLGIAIPPGATTFRVVRTSLAQRIVAMRLSTPYFMATIPRLTANFTTVPIAHRPRERGRSKFRLHRLASHAFDLYLGFSTRLRGGLVLTTVAVAAACVLESVLAAAGVLTGDGLGAVALMDAAVALCAAAMFGRYLVMGYDHAQRGPFYCVREANFPVDQADLLEPVPAESGAGVVGAVG